MKISDIKKLTRFRGSNYDANGNQFVKTIKEYVSEGLQLLPDFQRGYVWTIEQKTKYMEFLLKGGVTNNIFYFNHPNWCGSFEGDFVVDGLQRISAIMEFAENKVPVFGDNYLKDFEEEEKVVLRSFDVKVFINTLQTRKEVLNWYIEMNSCGTVHSSEEIERVKQLAENEK